MICWRFALRLFASSDPSGNCPSQAQVAQAAQCRRRDQQLRRQRQQQKQQLRWRRCWWINQKYVESDGDIMVFTCLYQLYHELYLVCFFWLSATFQTLSTLIQLLFLDGFGSDISCLQSCADWRCVADLTWLDQAVAPEEEEYSEFEPRSTFETGGTTDFGHIL